MSSSAALPAYQVGCLGVIVQYRPNQPVTLIIFFFVVISLVLLNIDSLNIYVHHFIPLIMEVCSFVLFPSLSSLSIMLVKSKLHAPSPFDAEKFIFH